MTAARRLTDEELIERIADRVVEKMRAPRPRPTRAIKASDTDRAAMRQALAKMGLRPKRLP